MEFFDLRPAGAEPGKPKIRTVNNTVLITFPASIVDRAALAGGAVKVQYGEAEGARALKITKDPDGAWSFKARKHSQQLYIREIMPEGSWPETDVEYRIEDGGLLITLPSPWVLKAEHLVCRRPAKGKRR